MTAAVKARIDHEFREPELLAQAFTHRSAGGPHNERLEFLGDAVIGLVVGEVLYNRFPKADEGQLTRARATLVNRDSLAEIARGLDLGSALRLGEGEMKSGGWRRDSILANALEAVVGAVYVDAGLDAARDLLLTLYAARLAGIDPSVTQKDAKTALQEYLQGRQLPLPRYLTVEITGPPHDQRFAVACDLEAPALRLVAEGRSRRQAEQEAARLVLEALTGQPGAGE